MFAPARFHLFPATLMLFALVAAAVTGCGENYEIRRYQAPKVTQVASTGESERMLAAIIPRGEQTWFLKMVGPDDAVAEQAAGFREVLESIEFVDGKPKWQLPDGWTETPGSGIRFATLKSGSPDRPLETSVTSLPSGDDEQAYILSNINRWRGQLKQKPVTALDLADGIEEVPLAEGTATLVTIVGTGGAGDSMRPPFAGGVDPGATPPSRPAAEPSSPLKYDTPDGWQPGELQVSRGGISIRHEAAFMVERDGKQVEITVDRLPPFRDLSANVNRWRAQVKLDAWSAEELAEQVEKIDIGGTSGDYVEIVGPEETILGAIAIRDNAAFYFKLKGANDLAADQQTAFREFISSVRFE